MSKGLDYFLLPELKQIPVRFVRADVIDWAKRDSAKRPGTLVYMVITGVILVVVAMLATRAWTPSAAANWYTFLVLLVIVLMAVWLVIDRTIQFRRSIRRALSMPWLPECPCCKYDMDGLDSGECPECGYQQGPLRKELWLERNNIQE